MAGAGSQHFTSYPHLHVAEAKSWERVGERWDSFLYPVCYRDSTLDQPAEDTRALAVLAQPPRWWVHARTEKPSGSRAAVPQSIRAGLLKQQLAIVPTPKSGAKV